MRTEKKAREETKPKIMTDKGNWQFTEDLIIRIKQSDGAAITEFFNANQKIFFSMAWSFLYKYSFLNRLYGVNDLVNQIFVDLPYYDFASRSRLYYCIIYGTFLSVDYGGIKFSRNRRIRQSLIISYDAPMGEDNKSSTYLLDTFISSPSAFEVLTANEDRETKDDEICAFLERTVTNKRYLNEIFCQLFTDIPKNQIRGDEYELYKQYKNRIS